MKRRRSGAPYINKPFKRPRTLSRQNAIVGRPERKNFDVEDNTPIIVAQTTAEVNTLNIIETGTGPTDRIGRRLNLVSLEFRYNGSLAPTTAGSSPLRLCIIYDRQTSGALPATTDVFVDDNITTLMNLNNGKRFKVLVDEIIDQGLSTAGPGSFIRKGFRAFKKPLPMEFVASTGFITDISVGACYAFTWQNGNLITAAPTARLFTRFRYTDV